MSEISLKPPVKHEYWTIAAHSVMIFLGQNLMQVVDLLFCRNLGSQASATVGTSCSLFAWFLILGIGLMSSLEFFIPHAIGEGNEKKANAFFKAGLIAAVLVGTVSTLGLITLASFTHVLGFNDEIASGVTRFSYVTAFSYIPVFLVPVLKVELQTRGHSLETTMAFIWGNLVNIFLNWVLVLGHCGVPALGIKGSALANLLSRVGIFAFLAFRAYQLRKKSAHSRPWSELPIVNSLKEIFRMGGPVCLHMLFEMGAFIFVSTVAARFTPAQTAAHSIAITLVSFTFMIPLGLCSAASLTISKAVGEKAITGAIHLGKISLYLGLAYATLSSIFYLFFRNLLVSFYTTDPETLAIGNRLLLIVVFFQFGDAMQVILAGCLRGFGETAIQAKANAVGHWLIGIPLGMVLCFYFDFQIAGLWIGLCTGLWCVAGGLLFFWWRKTTLHRSVHAL